MPIKLNKPGSQDWRTPPDLFKALHRIFKFTVDAAADASNNLLPRYWADNQWKSGLEHSWKKHRVFCNPPFGKTEQFLAKAQEAELAVFLHFRWSPVSLLITPRIQRPTCASLPSGYITSTPPGPAAK